VTHVLIANQHGENRGDEAAMRAMLQQFVEKLGEVRFTLLYQFRDRSLRLDFEEEVDDLPIVLPFVDYLRMGAYGLGLLMGLDLASLLSPTARRIVEAYRSADLVVSAPGGPYFGDIYAWHEIVHWWYVWLGHRRGTPLFYYAPSAGPFRNRLLNPVRRRLYRAFDTLVVREELSAEHIRGLLGEGVEVHVTADSALQSDIRPVDRHQHFAGPRTSLADRFLVAVSLNDYRYPGARDATACRERYDRTMIDLLQHVASRRGCHFLLMPQLFGQVHSDVPYLQRMAERLDGDVSWEIVDPSLDSDGQRGLFAACDLHVASRYHPAIFGHQGLVPGICIYYEHKALGFMSQLGLERFAFDIRSLDLSALQVAVDDLIDRRDEHVAHLRERIPPLRRRARRTTELAIELLRQRGEAGR
jgi:polysaccharide pyruvyl transferase WcaK-like protein